VEGLSDASPQAGPRISVILPSYNSAASLRRSLDSALGQTMQDLEVLVVDDASDDQSFSIAEAAAASEPRVVSLRNERNVGAAASRNRGIRRARGQWIAFLDADDWWAPERLERMLEAGGHADVVSDDLRVVSPGSARGEEMSGRSFLEHIGFGIGTPRELTLLEFVTHDLGLLKPIARREFLGQHGLGFDERFTIVHDFPLWAAVLARGARWIQLPDAYYYYSRAPEALSTRQRVMIREVIEGTEALLRERAVGSSPDVVAALRRRKREWEAHAAFITVVDLLRRRRLAALARLLAQDPGYIALILRRQSRHARLRATRRVRHPRRPSPARLL
jgi:succinoglycan biosynthesis protein ExoO